MHFFSRCWRFCWEICLVTWRLMSSVPCSKTVRFFLPHFVSRSLTLTVVVFIVNWDVFSHWNVSWPIRMERRMRSGWTIRSTNSKLNGSRLVRPLTPWKKPLRRKSKEALLGSISKLAVCDCLGKSSSFDNFAICFGSKSLQVLQNSQILSLVGSVGFV